MGTVWCVYSLQYGGSGKQGRVDVRLAGDRRENRGRHPERISDRSYVRRRGGHTKLTDGGADHAFSDEYSRHLQPAFADQNARSRCRAAIKLYELELENRRDVRPISNHEMDISFDRDPHYVFTRTAWKTPNKFEVTDVDAGLDGRR